MRVITLIGLAAMLLFMPVVFHAKENVQNTLTKCSAYYKNGNINILSCHSLLAVFHNQSSEKIIINRTISNPSASAGWSSELDANRSSVLFINKGDFILNCLKKNKLANYEKLECKKVLKTTLSTVNITSSSSYWVVENLLPTHLVPALCKRSFIEFCN